MCCQKFHVLHLSFQGPQPKAILYQDFDYTGPSVAIWAAGDYVDIALRNLPHDVLSSFLLEAGCFMTIYEHPSFGGRTYFALGSMGRLQTFDNIASSFKLSCGAQGVATVLAEP